MQKLIVVLWAVSLFLQPMIANGQVDAGSSSSGTASGSNEALPFVDKRSNFFVETLHTQSQARVRLAFTGDILIHNTVTAAARGSDGFDFRPMFDPVRNLIGVADLAICHLEVPLSPSSSNLSSYPLFNSPAEVAEALRWAGYDGCSTASNHSYDQGTGGVLGTLGVLDRAGLSQAGMAELAPDWRQPTYYEIDDLTIAHISATYWLNGLRLPADMEWLVQLLDVDEVLGIANRARAGGADLVVVSMHCCTEYRSSPTPSQLEMSHRLIESPDVDLVVTHHSHMVGPVERVGDEFILHGLGNFLSGQIQSPSLQDGVIAFANAVERNGRWRFESIDVAPTHVARGSYRIEPAKGASHERTMAALTEMGERISVFRSRTFPEDRAGDRVGARTVESPLR